MGGAQGGHELDERAVEPVSHCSRWPNRELVKTKVARQGEAADEATAVVRGRDKWGNMLSMVISPTWLEQLCIIRGLCSAARIAGHSKYTE